jgi:hypothetical protein
MKRISTLAMVGAFLASQTLGHAFTQEGSVSSTPPPAVTSPLTTEMLSEWIDDFTTDSALPGQSYYAQGEIAATKDLAYFLGQNPLWMTSFSAKVLTEQTMLTMEQSVAVFSLYGADPTSNDTQYWQGYEDTIQKTLDAMNGWPNTGGVVPGTSNPEYEVPTSSTLEPISTTASAPAPISSRKPRGQRN